MAARATAVPVHMVRSLRVALETTGLPLVLRRATEPAAKRWNSRVYYAIRAEPFWGGRVIIGSTRSGRLPGPRSVLAAARLLHRHSASHERKATPPAHPPESETDDSDNGGAARRARELAWILARVTHDLRLPLSGLFATVAALRLALAAGDPAASEERIVRLESQIRSLERLCNDVLTVQTGTTPLGQRPPRPLDAVVATIIETYRDEARQRSIQLTVEGSAPLAVDGRGEQIAHNLVHNAIRHARRKVYLKVHSTDQVARLEVEDDGPGLPPESVLRRLARRNISRGGSGWGIGIEAAIRTAAAAGGILKSLPSVPGGGARFLLVLPRPDAAACSHRHGPDSSKE